MKLASSRSLKTIGSCVAAHAQVLRFPSFRIATLLPKFTRLYPVAVNAGTLPVAPSNTAAMRLPRCAYHVRESGRKWESE